MYEFGPQTIMLRSVPQVLKKWRIVVNRISKLRQTTCSWTKKILDEATWMANVYLISWFFYLFSSCSISLLVKYDFILRYEAWVNAIRASSFIENVPQISAKPMAFQRNFSGSSHEIGHSLPNIFLRNWPGKFPRNRPFFPRICPWKSREIWLFFPRPTRSPVTWKCTDRLVFAAVEERENFSPEKFDDSVHLDLPFWGNLNIDLCFSFKSQVKK